MKTLDEILDRIYRDGLDGALSPEEYSYKQAKSDILKLMLTEEEIGVVENSIT